MGQNLTILKAWSTSQVKVTVGRRKYLQYLLVVGLFGVSVAVPAADSLDFSIGFSVPQNSPEGAIDSALTQICPTVLLNAENAASTLRAVCTFRTSVGASPEQMATLLKEISPKVNTAPALLVSRAPAIRFSGDVAARLASLRRGSRNDSKSNRFAFLPREPWFSKSIFRANSASTADNGLFSQRLSGFVNGNFSSAEQREAATEAGYQNSGHGVSVGVDYRLGLRTFLGVAPQYNNQWATLDDEGSELRATQYSLMLYGSHFLTDAWYIDGTLGRGNQQLNLIRKVQYTLGTESFVASAKGETENAQTSASVGTGSEFYLPYNANLSVSANLVYADSAIDSYTERDAGDLNLNVAGQKISSFTTHANVSLSRAFSFKSDVVVPQVGLTWVHELRRDGQELKASLVGDTNVTQFGFVTRNQDTDFYIFTLDAQVLVPGGRVAFARLSNVFLLRDHTETDVTVGYRMEF